MRDLLVAVIVFGSLPFILARPYVGALMWTWISVMNPHRLSFGFAYEYPFAKIIAAATLLALCLRLTRAWLPMTAPTVLLALFVAWMNVSTYFALVPDSALAHWQTVMSIMLMTFVTMMVLEEKRHLELMAWVLALSVGFYGFKGAFFTIAGGGSERVFGPPGTNLGDNNDLALALVMVIPLFLYLSGRAARRSVRFALVGGAGLCAISVLGTHSRGGLVAISALAFCYWLKSDNKLKQALVLAVIAPLALAAMPSKWFDRMQTISTYESDRSATGRINAWAMTLNVAMDRPFTGGGFQIYTPEMYRRYAPDPRTVLGPHSIYFSALGEHGFVGLGLFLMLALAAWRAASGIAARVRGDETLRWAGELARAIQLSLIGYAVGGIFLGLLYFDLPYYLLAMLVVLQRVVAGVARVGETAPSVRSSEGAGA
jgi:probable O-glycosylation ligase (exosortase A-associated)